MGILEFVHNEHAGLIPRAISQIFEYVQEHVDGLGDDITVSISFLQLYRETIQDLLAPAAVGSPEENLGIREDPSRGFSSSIRSRNQICSSSVALCPERAIDPSP